MKFVLPWLLTALVGCAPQPKPPATPPAVEPTAAPVVAPEAWRSTLPKSSAAHAFSVPPIESATLPNGLTVSVLHKQAGTVSVALILNRGASEVAREKAGLAPLTARLLTEGTLKQSAMQIAVSAEDLGSSFVTDATRIGSHVGLEVLLADLPKAVALLAECVRTPAFRAAEFERVRGEFVDGALGAEQDPGQHAAMLAVHHALGADLGSPVQGTSKTLRALRLEDVKRYHQKQWTPDHAALTIVGDVSLSDAMKLAESQFRTWAKPKAAEPPGQATPPLLELPNAGVLIYILDRPGSVQTAIAGAKSMGVRDDSVHVEREVVNKLFGGLFTSRLNTNLREEHAYTYGASSLFEANPAFGRFLLVTSVETPDTGAAVAEILSEVDGLAGGREPVRASEMERAASDLVQRLAGKMEHVTTLSPLLEAQFVEHLPSDYFTNYAARARSVTLERAKAEADEFGRKGLVLVLVGDAATVGPDMERRGLSYVDARPISDP